MDNDWLTQSGEWCEKRSADFQYKGSKVRRLALRRAYEQREVFVAFYTKHRPQEVESLVGEAVQNSVSKSFAAVCDALKKKYGDDPMALLQTASVKQIVVHDSCVNCHKRKAEYGDKTWCKKCAKAHKWEPLMVIPVGLFIQMIQPFLDCKDVISLSEVSKGMNAYFNQNSVWNKYHIEIVSKLRHDKVLGKLKTHPNSYIPRIYAGPWNDQIEMDIPRYFVNFKNESSVPYSLYQKCSESSFEIVVGSPQGKFLYIKDIKPGESTHIPSVGGSKWICLPTKGWMSENHVEGTGHLVTIPMENGQSPFHSMGVNWRDYTHTIKEKDFKPMKELFRKYRDRKGEFIKRKIDPSELFTLSTSNEQRMYEQQLEIDALYRQVRLLEANMKVYKRRHYVYQKMKKMFIKFKPFHDISMLWKKDEE
jgi:hypothetical protein